MNNWYAGERRLYENRSTKELAETAHIIEFGGGSAHARRQVRLEAIKDILAEREQGNADIIVEDKGAQ